MVRPPGRWPGRDLVPARRLTGTVAAAGSGGTATVTVVGVGDGVRGRCRAEEHLARRRRRAARSSVAVVPAVSGAAAETTSGDDGEHGRGRCRPGRPSAMLVTMTGRLPRDQFVVGQVDGAARPEPGSSRASTVRCCACGRVGPAVGRVVRVAGQPAERHPVGVGQAGRRDRRARRRRRRRPARPTMTTGMSAGATADAAHLDRRPGDEQGLRRARSPGSPGSRPRAAARASRCSTARSSSPAAPGRVVIRSGSIIPSRASVTSRDRLRRARWRRVCRDRRSRCRAAPTSARTAPAWTMSSSLPVSVSSPGSADEQIVQGQRERWAAAAGASSRSAAAPC